MSTLKKSLQTLGSIAVIGGLVAATPIAASAQSHPCAPRAGAAANPCAPKAKKMSNPCKPSAKKTANPCAASNPCAPKKK